MWDCHFCQGHAGVCFLKCPCLTEQWNHQAETSAQSSCKGLPRWRIRIRDICIYMPHYYWILLWYTLNGISIIYFITRWLGWGRGVGGWGISFLFYLRLATVNWLIVLINIFVIVAIYFTIISSLQGLKVLWWLNGLQYHHISPRLILIVQTQRKVSQSCSKANNYDYILWCILNYQLLLMEIQS